jgi:hypothetical protein
MQVIDQIGEAWNPHVDSIRCALSAVAKASMPDEAEFLWFVFLPQELQGFPVKVWPTERNQQQHDGWRHENDLQLAVPGTVCLSEDLTATVEAVDALRDATADFLMEQWNAIGAPPDRLAYFSMCDDGFYFSMRDGRKISAWDIENEVAAQSRL